MNIGIAGPVEIRSLKNNLANLKPGDLDLGLGGTAVNILINQLIEDGHKVIVFTLDPNVKSKYVLEGPSLKIIIGHFRNQSKLKWFDFCRNEFLQIKNFIIEERDNIDIVNAHWSYEFAIGTILAKVPHVITFRDHAKTILKLFKYHPYRMSRLLMDNWVRNNGKYFSFNSEYLKQQICLKNKKVFPVIPNPFPCSSLKSQRAYPRKSVLDIGFVSNGWGHLKNAKSAIEGYLIALKENQNIRLHFFGSGMEESSKNAQHYLSKASPGVMYFHGKLPYELLQKQLQNIDIMLHTSREESFGNNLVEAMANGIPVIAGSKAGAVPWVLNYGEAGILVDIENPNEIANAITSLVEDRQLYEKLSEAGVENVKQRFLSASVSAHYLSLFNRIHYS